MVSIVHALNCLIATDPAATAAGKITPATWNAAHTLTQSGAGILGATAVGATSELSLSQALDLIGSATQGDVLFRSSGAWARLPVGTSGQVLTSQGAGVDLKWGTQSTSPFTDASALVMNGSDGTKKIIISAASVTTGTTRTLTAQDKDYTIADKAIVDLKAPILSPTFTGTPAAPTPVGSDSSTTIATTAFPAAQLTSMQSNGTSGYQKFPGGLILQWGQMSGSSGTTNFTTAFATAAYTICLSNDTTNNGGIISARTKTSFSWNISTSSNLNYLAIGF